MSVRELDDGRVLVNAFCGCQTEDVLAKLGLTLADLFEKPLGHWTAPTSSRISARDLLALIDEEALVIALLASDSQRTRTLEDSSWQRIALAVSRIGKARTYGR